MSEPTDEEIAQYLLDSHLYSSMSPDSYRAFGKWYSEQAVKAEREKCAAICDNQHEAAVEHNHKGNDAIDMWGEAAKLCAKSIRDQID